MSGTDETHDGTHEGAHEGTHEGTVTTEAGRAAGGKRSSVGPPPHGLAPGRAARDVRGRTGRGASVR